MDARSRSGMVKVGGLVSRHEICVVKAGDGCTPALTRVVFRVRQSAWVGATEERNFLSQRSLQGFLSRQSFPTLCHNRKFPVVTEEA